MSHFLSCIAFLRAITALRKLKEKTGYNIANTISNYAPNSTSSPTPYLEQLASWGSAERDPRGWSVTQAYFALLPLNSTQEILKEQLWLDADKA